MLIIVKYGVYKNRSHIFIAKLNITLTRNQKFRQWFNNMNFVERSCIVLGKGNKQREVYFDVRTKLHIEKYLKTRDDNNVALFVSKNKPHQRLTSATIFTN